MMRRLGVSMLVGLMMIVTGAVRAQELPDHAAFTAVLGQHVQGPLVDYAALQQNRSGLDAYLESLARTDRATIEAAPRDAQLAFWINAYNACALRLVIDHYPIKQAGFPASLVRSLQGVPANSIRQVADTWKREFCEVAGKARALDEIEHEIIRPIGEPRIHFAVNCASRSCPVLASEAYTGAQLDEQLDDAVRRLMASPEHFQLESGDPPRLRLNKVLDWYKDDFGGTDGVVEFFVPYVRADEAAMLASGLVRVEYFDYDWTLNDTAVFGRGR
jgi:hypothetical protein